MRSLWFPLMALLILGLWGYTRFGPAPHVNNEPPMPAKVIDAEERELYLSPGGAYTAADIEANDRQTASAVYRDFRAAHDPNPQPGDSICPITLTKADPRCSWVVGGRRYTFCCPPCIDEFVRRAKIDPARFNPAEEYIRPGSR